MATSWLLDPCKRADEELLKGGVEGLAECVRRSVAGSPDVPEITATSVPPPAKPAGDMLVRVRGMVQDVSSSQHFVVAKCSDTDLVLHRHQQHNGLTGVTGTIEGSCRDELFVVSFVYVVPVPGKRCEPAALSEATPPSGPARVNTAVKRTAEGRAVSGGGQVSAGDEEMAGGGESPAPAGGKKCGGTAGLGVGAVYGGVDVARNFVCGGGGGAVQQGNGFVVRLFGEGDQVPRVNQLIDAWGVLEPLDSDLSLADLGVATHLPPALFRTVSGLAWAAPAPAPAAPPAAGVRGALITHLSGAAGGDRAAGEMLLLQLLSDVAQHRPVPLAYVPLNLTGLDERGAREVIAAVRNLVDASVAYRVTVPELNVEDWVPFMDYEKEYLKTGRLQLMSGTVLVLDETGIAEGTLSPAGLRNLSALHDFALAQHVAYPCSFAALELDVNVPCLVLSQLPSLLKLPHVVPVRPVAPPPASPADAPLPESAIDTFRQYISGCRAAVRKVTLDPSTEEAVAAAMSDSRRRHGSKFKESAVVHENTLHTWMTLATLHAASLGASVITRDHWAHVVELGNQILDRL
ncbi:Mini-chromosome maintenance complex-binding protein [Diplonema papillatum]|nr:Mini-chromosome maintenance complex-binding protein [Diplonema papillatum]